MTTKKVLELAEKKSFNMNSQKLKNATEEKISTSRRVENPGCQYVGGFFSSVFLNLCSWWFRMDGGGRKKNVSEWVLRGDRLPNPANHFKIQLIISKCSY